MCPFLIRRELWTQTPHIKTTLCENEDKILGDASTSQRMPKSASGTPEARREAWNDSPSQPPKGANPANT